MNAAKDNFLLRGYLKRRKKRNKKQNKKQRTAPNKKLKNKRK